MEEERSRGSGQERSQLLRLPDRETYEHAVVGVDEGETLHERTVSQRQENPGNEPLWVHRILVPHTEAIEHDVVLWSLAPETCQRDRVADAVGQDFGVGLGAVVRECVYDAVRR